MCAFVYISYMYASVAITIKMSIDIIILINIRSKIPVISRHSRHICVCSGNTLVDSNDTVWNPWPTMQLQYLLLWSYPEAVRWNARLSCDKVECDIFINLHYYLLRTSQIWCRPIDMGLAHLQLIHNILVLLYYMATYLLSTCSMARYWSLAI